MAILTATGRAALAAAIKQQSLHLALGEGDPIWDTPQTQNATWDTADAINTGFQHIAELRVLSQDEVTEYVRDVDYSVNAREGVVRWLVNSATPKPNAVKLLFKVSHPPEPIAQTGLLREVGRRVVNEVHFVAEDPAGEIVVPTGRYALSQAPTNHLFIRVRFDFEDAATAIVREQGLFVDTQTLADLPVGQLFFTPTQITEAGILLVLQNSVPIVRQPSTRETFEFVVTF